MNKAEHTRLVLFQIKQHTDEVILFYSGGRDSLVLLDLLSRTFTRVHCVFMYFIKGLDVYKPYLDWVNKYSNATLYQYPHWQLSHQLKSNYLNLNAVNNSKIKTIKLKDIEEASRRDTGCKWIVQGFKKSDGLSRRLFLNTYTFDAINASQYKAFPLALWSQKNVEEYIIHKNIIRPIVFKGQNTHGIGLNESALIYLRDRHPADLEKILKVFPLANSILFEYDYRKQNTSITEIQG